MNDQEKNLSADEQADSVLPSEEHDPGLAGRMARAFITSPLTPILLLASLAIGLLGLMITPRQEDPQISVPMVDIFVQFPGASSDQVATMVAEPLERIMKEIDGVEHVYSASQRGMTMVTVQFYVGEEMEPSLVKLFSKLQSNMDKVPPGATQPLVKPRAIDDVPMMAFTLWSNELDDAALRKLGNDVLQRLNELENTGPGFVIGGRNEQFRVNVDPSRVAAFGVSMDHIAGAIMAANKESRAGSFELGQNSYTVYSGRFLQSAPDVASIVVGVQNGAPVYLKNVADVSYGPSETKHIVRHYTGQAYEGDQPSDGASAVTVAIAKQKGTNGVSVAKELLAKMDVLKGYLIPDNVHVTVTRDYGKTAEDKVNELIFKLFVATGAVTLLVLVTLGMRPAIVTVVVIPIVILFAIFGAYMLNMTIDRVSLFAMIFAIGILVDDAVVVVENIYRRWLMEGKTDVDTAVDAVREVGNPTIIATFTVVAALLPMAFVGGMMGPYMAPIPALGSVAMIFSLVAAFVFTPWLIYKIRPSLKGLHKAEKSEERFQNLVGKVYHGIIFKLLTNRLLAWLTLILIIVAFFASCVLFYTKAVTVKMMPYDNKGEFDVVINMPAGTALTDTASVATRLAQTLRTQIPELIDLQTYSGTASPYNFNGLVRHYYMRQEPWQADIQVKILDKHERKRTSHQIAVATRDFLTPIAHQMGARIAVVEMPPGPPVLSTMVADVYGPTPEIRREVAEHLTQVFEEATYVGDVDNYMQAPHKEIHFVIDNDKAMRKGITRETINRTLMMTMGGFTVSTVHLGHSLEPTDIVLQVPESERAIPSNLADLPVATPTGATVPLQELGEFVEEPADPYVYHKDLRPVEYVVGESIGKLAAPIYGQFEVQDLLKNYVAPDGVKLEGYWINPPKDDYKSAFKWEGEWHVTYITFRDMGIAFAAAMLLIYILVVWEFGTYMIPLIIISPIPLTLVGIIPGHWIMGAEFTATSMIGFIALAGIIVRNSILLVDFTLEQVRHGVAPREALAKAGQVRMRPIILTAGALILGSSVILTDPIFQGMAVSLLFGVFVATLLTLIVIPMGCDSYRRGLVESCGNGEGDEPDDDGPGGPGNDGGPSGDGGDAPAVAKKTVIRKKSAGASEAAAASAPVVKKKVIIKKKSGNAASAEVSGAPSAPVKKKVIIKKKTTAEGETTPVTETQAPARKKVVIKKKSQIPPETKEENDVQSLKVKSEAVVTKSKSPVSEPEDKEPEVAKAENPAKVNPQKETKEVAPKEVKKPVKKTKSETEPAPKTGKKASPKKKPGAGHRGIRLKTDKGGEEKS